MLGVKLHAQKRRGLGVVPPDLRQLHLTRGRVEVAQKVVIGRSNRSQ
jgi:hypothetical protein